MRVDEVGWEGVVVRSPIVTEGDGLLQNRFYYWVPETVCGLLDDAREKLAGGRSTSQSGTSCS